MISGQQPVRNQAHSEFYQQLYEWVLKQILPSLSLEMTAAPADTLTAVWEGEDQVQLQTDFCPKLISYSYESTL